MAFLFNGGQLAPFFAQFLQQLKPRPGQRVEEVVAQATEALRASGIQPSAALQASIAAHVAATLGCSFQTSPGQHAVLPLLAGPPLLAPPPGIGGASPRLVYAPPLAPLSYAAAVTAGGVQQPLPPAGTVITQSGALVQQAPPVATPAEVDGALAQAHEAYKLGNYGRAVQLCQSVYSGGSRRTDLLLLLGACHYQLGQYDLAVYFNDACILVDPQLAEAHANLANALQQCGNLDLAIMYYQSALRLKPGFSDAYNNMATALLQKGLVLQAMDCYNSALAVNPGLEHTAPYLASEATCSTFVDGAEGRRLTDVRTNLGDLWRAQGEQGRAAALQCYTEVLRLDNTYAPAWRGLGDCYREAGDHGQAVTCYQEAVRLQPSYADAFTGLGVSLKELRRREESEACFQAVVRLRPGCALSLGNLAGAYYEAGKLELAIATYREALQHQPNFPEAYNNLGNALREAGRLDEAVACYTVCIQLQMAAAAPAGAVVGPGGRLVAAPAPAGNNKALAVQHAQRLSVAYNNLGGILKLQGRMAECVTCYEHVVALQSGSPEALANLASAYKDSGRQDEAIVSYRQALGVRPDFPEAFANYVHSLQCVCEWRDRPQLFARLEAEVRRDLAGGRLPSVQPFHAMAYPFPAHLALQISTKYAEFCASVAARLALPPLAHPPARPLARGERLRVAYVSSDFGNHPLSHLMGSVFGMHNKSKVEIFCYALSPNDGSEWRQRIAAEAEHFLDVSSWGVSEIAQRISADSIHVAVNLNGYTKGARNEIFALRPAPVQCSYMGFPATTGADFLPYLIIDKVVCPPESRHCYSEKVAYMPHCYFVNDYKQAHQDIVEEEEAGVLPTRASAGLPDDKIIYACSNQLYKYDPETFTTWCNILRRVPNSVLWLLRFPPYGEPRIKAEAAARGIDPARVIFTDVAAKPVHIRRSGLADVFLDTPLCNAHTTGCDVLWSGCPMVTLPLERMASRVAASLCAATGLGHEMIVSSQQEYEEKAVELGTDHAKRLGLRSALKSRRGACPLFDTAQWVRDLEKVLFRMWDIHCEGAGPRDFEVQ
ncbi:hypothetical protein N2152v2_006231 [Parachlorella kessleri]